MNPIIDKTEAMRQEAIALLVADRDAIDGQLAKLGYSGETVNQPAGKKKACSICGSPDHNARTCPNKKAGDDAPASTTPSI